MKRRRIAVVAVLALAGAAWWLWPTAPEPEPERVVAKQPAKKRVFNRFTNAEVPVRDDPLMAEAAAGDLGPEMQQRVCDLCKEGLIDGETCAPCEPEEFDGGLLIVDVVDEEGRPAERARIWMRGCEYEPRGWREFIVRSGTCQVSAGRRDGALWAQAEPVRTAVPQGEDTYVQLELSNARTGGLGVSVRGDPDGVRVLAVMPNTPASEMGLEAGDLIVEVDGLDTTEIGLQEFIRTMTGPENTDVDFVLQFETDTGIAQEPLTITRQYLEPSG